MDDITVRKRLITNESVTAPLGPKRIATEYLSFVSTLQQQYQQRSSSSSTTILFSSSSSSSASSTDSNNNNNNNSNPHEHDQTNSHRTVSSGSQVSSTTQVLRSYDKLITTLAQYDFLVDKLQLINERYQDDQHHYHHIQQDIQQQMNTTENDIQKLKAQLEQARETRAQRMEAETLAKNVNKHPTRDALHAQLVTIENDYQTTLQEQYALDKKLEQRKTQFMLLQNAIKDISISITEEATAERKRIEDEAKAVAIEALQRKAATLQKLQQQKNNNSSGTNTNLNDKNDINEEDDDTGTILRINEEETTPSDDQGPVSSNTVDGSGEDGPTTSSLVTTTITTTTTTTVTVPDGVSMETDINNPQITSLSSTNDHPNDAMEDGEM